MALGETSSKCCTLWSRCCFCALRLRAIKTSERRGSIPQLVLLGLEPLEDNASCLVGLKDGLEVLLDELVAVGVGFLHVENKLEHLEDRGGGLQQVHAMSVFLGGDLGDTAGQEIQDGGAAYPVMVDYEEEALPRILSRCELNREKDLQVSRQFLFLAPTLASTPSMMPLTNPSLSSRLKLG